MDELKKFVAWKREHGYTDRGLAEELGFGADYINMISRGTRSISLNFKLKFISRFGRDEAQKAFDAAPLLSALETI